MTHTTRHLPIGVHPADSTEMVKCYMKAVKKNRQGDKGTLTVLTNFVMLARTTFERKVN